MGVVFKGLNQVFRRPLVLVSAFIAGLSWYMQTEAATAYATVSVTIVQPVSRGGEIQVYPSALSLGSPAHAITVINGGTAPLRIAVRLGGVPADGCNIRYSPKFSEIPPGNSQVVRILDRSDTPEACGNGMFLEVQQEGRPMEAIDIPLLASATE